MMLKYPFDCCWFLLVGMVYEFVTHHAPFLDLATQPLLTNAKPTIATPTCQITQYQPACTKQTMIKPTRINQPLPNKPLPNQMLLSITRYHQTKNSKASPNPVSAREQVIAAIAAVAVGCWYFSWLDPGPNRLGKADPVSGVTSARWFLRKSPWDW